MIEPKMLMESALYLEPFLAEMYYAYNLTKAAASFFIKAKRRPSAEEATELRNQAESEAKQTIPAATNFSPISSVVVANLMVQLRKCDEDIAAAYIEPNVPISELPSWVGQLERQYCFYASEIRKYNSGQVPDWLAPIRTVRCFRSDGSAIYTFDKQ